MLAYILREVSCCLLAFPRRATTYCITPCPSAMRPRDVYAKELATLIRGHAVLDPRRDRLQDGGLRQPINVGDVVYDLDGKLIRLFNCLVPAEQQDADCIFPEDFEVLEMTQTRNVARTIPITVKESYCRPGPFYSKGVQRLEVEAGASVAYVTLSISISVILT